MPALTLPFEYDPRPYQVPLWNAIMHGSHRYAVAVWHRRAGKDLTAAHISATKLFRDGGYHLWLAPTTRHARRVFVDSILGTGRSLIDQVFPEALRRSWSSQEMRLTIDCANGKKGVLQIAGSDTSESYIGTNPSHVTLSEWALSSHPEAWSRGLQPILEENRGSAVFVSTPRGENHFARLFRMAETNPEWFTSHLGWRDTLPMGGTVTEAYIESVLASGVSPMEVAQEYEARFTEAGANDLIDPELLATVIARTPSPKVIYAPLTVVACDVARFGDDSACIASRQGFNMQSIPPILIPRCDVIQLAQRIHDHAHAVRAHAVVVDGTGVGGGVCDVLRRTFRIPAHEVTFAGRPNHKAKFADARTELYARFADALKHPHACLTPHKRLREELTGIVYDVDNEDRMKLEHKSKTKQRLGRSPDMADAYALTWAVDEHPDQRRGDHGIPSIRHASLGSHDNRKAIISW